MGWPHRYAGLFLDSARLACPVPRDLTVVDLAALLGEAFAADSDQNLSVVRAAPKRSPRVFSPQPCGPVAATTGSVVDYLRSPTIAGSQCDDSVHVFAFDSAHVERPIPGGSAAPNLGPSVDDRDSLASDSVRNLLTLVRAAPKRSPRVFSPQPCGPVAADSVGSVVDYLRSSACAGSRPGDSSDLRPTSGSAHTLCPLDPLPPIVDLTSVSVQPSLVPLEFARTLRPLVSSAPPSPVFSDSLSHRVPRDGSQPPRAHEQPPGVCCVPDTASLGSVPAAGMPPPTLCTAPRTSASATPAVTSSSAPTAAAVPQQRASSARLAFRRRPPKTAAPGPLT